MLVELVVENYAVVERVRVRFHAGLNLLTGETGSGKSIVVDALALLFGGRTSSEMVRSGAERARISGIFELPKEAGLRALLESAGVEAEEGELLLVREILGNGKSRAFAASRPVTAALLRDIAPYLGDIHGQHAQQVLFAPATQLEMLDQFGGDGALVDSVAALFGEWKRCSRELSELDLTEQEKLRLGDLWTFQRKEIESAAPKAGEDAVLETERLILKNVGRLQEAASEAYAALYDSEESAAKQLRVALRRVEELCRIDASLALVQEQVRSADIAAVEASVALRDYLDRLESDPKRLDGIEGRLEVLDRLKRKYGSSLEEVLAFLESVRAQLGALETTGERRAELEQNRARLAEEFEQAAGRLSETRRATALDLSARVEHELATLAMGNSVFKICVEDATWSETGANRVEFLISANAGEEPRALEKVASGGELSRIALALKTGAGAAPTAGVPRTLVFDEVDAGIGGGVAEAVGRRLKRLAAGHQVLCVTHLAQVAGFADHHYSVEKREVGGRTVAEVEELVGEARTREIGRMLSGQRVTPEALLQAEQLIKLGAGGV